MKKKLSLLLITLLYASISYSQPDTTMYQNIAVNDTFQIKLNTISDAGYSWQWVNKSEVDKVDTIRTTSEDTPHAEGLVGYPTITNFTFKGIKVGSDTVKLVYGHSWEKTAKKDTAYLIVTVKNNTITKEITINDTFHIKLTTISDAGYSWQWVNKSEVDKVDTTQISSEDTPHAEGLIGYSTITDFTFKGIKAGTDTVKLVYGHSWEKLTTKDTLYLIVTVKDTFPYGLISSNVKSYPNPTKDILNLSLDSNLTNYICEIYNSNGIKISTVASTSPQLSINTSGYTTGSYVLIVIQNKKVLYKTRFIKK
jgi:predicted secreted protein